MVKALTHLVSTDSSTIDTSSSVRFRFLLLPIFLKLSFVFLFPPPLLLFLFFLHFLCLSSAASLNSSFRSSVSSSNSHILLLLSSSCSSFSSSSLFFLTSSLILYCFPLQPIRIFCMTGICCQSALGTSSSRKGRKRNSPFIGNQITSCSQF